MGNPPPEAQVAEAPHKAEAKVEAPKAAEVQSKGALGEWHKELGEELDKMNKPGAKTNDGVTGLDDRSESGTSQRPSGELSPEELAKKSPAELASLGLGKDGKKIEAITPGPNGVEQVNLDNKVPGLDMNGDGKPDDLAAPLTDETEGAAHHDHKVEGAKGEKGEAGEEGESGGEKVVADGKDDPNKKDGKQAVENENLEKKSTPTQVELDTDGNQILADGSKAKVVKKAGEVGSTQDEATGGGPAPGPGAPTGGLNSTRPAPAALEKPAAPKAAPETDAPSVPATATDNAEAAALKKGPEVPKTPDQVRIEEASKALDTAFKGDPNDAQMREDRATFLARTDITDKQKADALEKFASTTKGELDPNNKYRSGMDQKDVLKAVAGGMNDVAKPRAIDQGDNGTCNATTIQEGLAFGDPAKYADHLKEAALHGTYTGDDNFRAIIPSSMLKPHESASGAQNIDNVRNFSSQLMQGGMLNHMHQQGKGGEVKNPDGSVKYPAGTKQYYTDSDAGGEQRYLFNADALKPGGTGNPFRDDAGRPTAFVESGAGVGVNQEGFMGRNAGIKGQFLLAQRNFLDANELANLDPSVKLVGSAEELTAAKAARARDFGGESGKAGTWSVAVVNANNGLFRGGEGQGGAGGGHVVSTYFDAANPGKGDLSNQWGKQFDRKGVSDVALFNAMDYNNKSSAGDRGTPAEGKYDDNTLPQRFKQHEETTPNAHRDGIHRGDDPGPGDRRQEDKDKAKEKEEEKKKPEGEDKKQNGDPTGKKSGLLNRQGQIKAHYAQLEGQINSKLTQASVLADFQAARADLLNINTEIRNVV